MIKKSIVFIILTLFITTVIPVTGENNNIKISENNSQIELDTDWWPMFHYDLNHSGYTQSNGPLTNNVYWNYTTDGIVYSPMVNDNKVYFTGCGGITCLNSITGDFIWKYELDACVGSSPAIANGNIYFGGETKIFCLEANDGTYIWNYTTNGFISSSPAVENGIVYIGSDDKSLYCLDANSGSYLWKYTTLDIIRFSSPAIANGKVYIGSDKIYCLNADTGSWVWDYTTGDDVVSSPAVANGKIYVGSNDNKIYCLNADTGSKIWEYSTNGNIDSSPAITDNNKVYFGSHDKKIYCLDTSNGALIWSYLTSDGIFSSPGIVESKIYIGSGDNDGNIYCLGIDNQPPNKPTILGSTTGKPGATYEYSFVTTDPDDDNIAEYFVTWGDGQQQTITGPFSSGDAAKASHSWSDQGEYTITAKAKDVNSLISPEGTLDIIIPRNRFSNTYLLKWIIYRYPFFKWIIEKI